MNQTQKVVNPDHVEEREYGIIDLLIVLARYKKQIILFPIIVGLVAAAVSMILPEAYKASTKLLPPQQAQFGAAALLSQLGGPAAAMAGAAGIKSPNDLYVGMLKSRTVADRLIKAFDLQKVYNVDSLDKTRKILEENSIITSGKDGLITIEVEDADKKRAAPLANAYVTELTKLTAVLAVTEAGQRRMFFERQLELAKNNLSNAEVGLKRALDTYGVISVDSNSRVLVETVGRIRAQISAKEIQLASMQAFVTATNPEYRRTQEELNSLHSELSKLENGRPSKNDEMSNSADKPAGLENIKILRDVKYYQMLYELLAKQYEMARLDEAKDSSLIQVLDLAIDPERRVKPKRAIIVLLSMMLALLASIAWAFIIDAKKKMLQIPGAGAQWEELKALIRFR